MAHRSTRRVDRDAAYGLSKSNGKMNRLKMIRTSPMNQRLPQKSPAALRVARIDLEYVERFGSLKPA